MSFKGIVKIKEIILSEEKMELKLESNLTDVVKGEKVSLFYNAEDRKSYIAVSYEEQFTIEEKMGEKVMSMLSINRYSEFEIRFNEVKEITKIQWLNG